MRYRTVLQSTLGHHLNILTRAGAASATLPGSCSRILPHVLGGRASRVVRRSQVALMERTDLVLLECADDRMEQAAVVEKHQVVLAPTHQDPNPRRQRAARIGITVTYQSWG